MIILKLIICINIKITQFITIKSEVSNPIFVYTNLYTWKNLILPVELAKWIGLST